MKSQGAPGNPRIKCPVSAQPNKRGVSRTSVAYWRDRVAKVKSKNGAASPDYSVRIVYQGRRVRFPLRSSNKEAAAAKVAEIFNFLLSEGWEKTVWEFKFGSQKEVLNSASVTVEASPEGAMIMDGGILGVFSLT